MTVRRLTRCHAGHSDTVTQLASSTSAPDFLLSGSKDKTVRLWHLSSGDCVAYIDLNATALVRHRIHFVLLECTRAHISEPPSERGKRAVCVGTYDRVTRSAGRRTGDTFTADRDTAS